MVVRSNIFDPIHDELCPEIWDGSELKPEVMAFILDKFQTWAEQVGIPTSINEIHILGGIAGYQYNATSDIDVNVVLDLTQEEISAVQKTIPNGTPIPGTEHPVNFYLSTKFLEAWLKEINGVYDLLLQQWVKQPDKEDAQTPVKDYEAVVEIARFFIAGLDAVVSEYYRDVDEYNVISMFKEENGADEDITFVLNMCVQNIMSDIDGLRVARHIIKALRGEAFLGTPMETVTEIAGSGANNSINNLVYKYIEKLEYFSIIENIVRTETQWKKLLC